MRFDEIIKLQHISCNLKSPPLYCSHCSVKLFSFWWNLFEMLLCIMLRVVREQSQRNSWTSSFLFQYFVIRSKISKIKSKFTDIIVPSSFVCPWKDFPCPAFSLEMLCILYKFDRFLYKRMTALITKKLILLLK